MAKSRKGGRWTLILLAATLLLPVLEVACARFITPPITPLMVLRRIAAGFSNKHPRRILYEWIPLRETPPAFLKDVWIAEDERFFKHNGFDFKEIERDIKIAEKKGKPAWGASTITQQCARSTFLWEGRSWVRKGLEAYYTALMEAFLPKRRIFELYVNVIEMGDGVYGVRAASKHHFGASPANLTREQTALLAAMLPNPRQWDPRRPEGALVKREQRVLREAGSVHFPIELLR